MLAREGYIPIACMLLLSAITWLLLGWTYAILGLLVTAYVIRLHVIIPRRISSNSLHLLAPVTGKVQAVKEVRDLVADQDGILVSTGIRFPGIGPIRAPVDGKVIDFKVDCATTAARGASVTEVGPESEPAFSEHQPVTDPVWEAERSPNCYVVTLETDVGERVSYAIRSRGRHSRFRSKFAPGERAARGKFCGFVYFGSVCEVIVPTNVDPNVAQGDRVRAGSTTIAQLIHS